MRQSVTVLTMFVLLTGSTPAQELSFEEYDPPSSLKVPEHPIRRARYPFIDVHNHQIWTNADQGREVVRYMDSLNMAVMINLSGRGFRRIQRADGTQSWSVGDGDVFRRTRAMADSAGASRFIWFTNVDFEGIGTDGWAERAVRQLEADVQAGAKGLKIYKSLGMNITDAAGKRVSVDDARIDPIWQKCAELKIPVLIHTADPAQFWQPHDKHNERWLELKLRPNRKRDSQNEAPWETLMAEQENVFRKHPKTVFINAHLGWFGNDLARLGKMFDALPNVYSEIGAVLAELGRQPRFAREFFIKYQDRILFGKDSWEPSEYYTYFRVLETADEYFDYYRRYHAFWKMYGLDLPDDVLQKVYYKNALRIVPGIDRSLFPGS